MSDNKISCNFLDKQIQSTYYRLEYELLYVLEGKMELTINESTHTLLADDFYLVNTGCAHSWKATDNILIASLIIPFGLLKEYYPNSEMLFSCNSLTMSPDTVITTRKILCKIFTYSYHKHQEGHILYDLSCTQLLYLLSSSCLAPSSNPIRNIPTEEKDKRAYELIKYISENYASELTLNEVAKHFHLSPPYLSKYFKERLGTNFLAYIKKIRLEHAINDLEYSDKSITQITTQSGFPNANSFIHSFREVYGCTPNEYRKKHSKHSKELTQNNLPPDTSASGTLQNKVESYLKGTINTDNPEQFYGSESITVLQPVQNCQPLNRSWEQLINMGNAINLLRYDVRDQLSYYQKEIGFKYVYLSNLLHPSMKINPDQTTGSYNFTEVRKVLDYIVSLGMHPYIELDTQEIDPIYTANQDLLTSKVQSLIPKLYVNKPLFDSFLDFILSRYGADEVSHWYFSLQRSSARHNSIAEEDYFRYFASIYNNIKAKIPSAHIGGPGFSVDFSEDRLERFLQNWKRHNCLPDFINLYVIPYVYDADSNNTAQNLISPNRDYLSNSLTHLSNVLERTSLNNREIHVSIWNLTLSSHNILNDSCHKASYIIRNVLNNFSKCSILGYWGASDIGMYDGENPQLLFGGVGLISQNDLKKPAFHAFSFLHKLLPQVVAQSDHMLVTTSGQNRYTICCHNYKHYNALFYQKNEDGINIEEQPLLFEDQELLNISITIEGLSDGEYLIVNSAKKLH